MKLALAGHSNEGVFGFHRRINAVMAGNIGIELGHVIVRPARFDAGPWKGASHVYGVRQKVVGNGPQLLIHAKNSQKIGETVIHGAIGFKFQTGREIFHSIHFGGLC